MPKYFYQAETFTGRKSVGYLVRRVFNLMMPRAEALFADAELSFAQWVALMSVREGTARTCADLARHMNHDTGATTRLVDQLEHRGLIARSRSKADRRMVHLTLTPRGKAVAKSLTPYIVDFWNRILEDFSRPEATALIDLLTRVGNRLEDEPIAAPPVAEKVRAAR